MFKLRRRSVADVAATDQPFCGMCGTTMRVDATSGRCALGHRVTSPGTLLAPTASAEAADEATAVIADSPLLSYEPTAELSYVPNYDEPVAHVGEGLYEAYSSADVAGRAVTWDDVVAPSSGGPSSVYDDYLTWSEPTAELSTLDYESAVTPVVDADDDQDDSAGPVLTPIEASDLLDELDDATHARRQTFGTIGATVAVTGMVAGAVAILPF